jgi:hypothetical protein
MEYGEVYSCRLCAWFEERNLFDGELVGLILVATCCREVKVRV